MSLRALRDLIESSSRKFAPGVLELVNLYCNLKFKQDYLAALTERPECIVEILKKLYTPDVAELIIYEIFTKPIVEITGRGDPRELARLATRNLELFKDEVKKLLETIVSTTHS